MPPTPASMLRTKRSWPGTSTKPTRTSSSFEESKAEIDGDAAALFFFETVGIRAGERFDERGFAVVDVAGGADDDVLGGFHQQDSMRWTMLADAWRLVKLGHDRKRPTTRTSSSWLPGIGPRGNLECESLLSLS